MPPKPYEIPIPVDIGSDEFEYRLQSNRPFSGLAIADNLGILCYTNGAMIAGLFRQYLYRQQD